MLREQQKKAAFTIKKAALEKIKKCYRLTSVSYTHLIAQKIKKPIRYMAKMELFQNPFVGFIIRHLGAFPVARGKGDTSAIDTAVEDVYKRQFQSFGGCKSFENAGDFCTSIKYPYN